MIINGLTCLATAYLRLIRNITSASQVCVLNTFAINFFIPSILTVEPQGLAMTVATFLILSLIHI